MRTLTMAAAGLLAVFLLAVATALDQPADPRPVSSQSTDQPRFDWPLAPRPTVERPFDPPSSDFGPGHRGVDLRADADQEVRAAGAGYVVFAGDLAGRGVVSIEHDALRTTYEPVRPAVERGDRVRTGQVIGTVVSGHDGCPRPACLHWGARRSGAPPEYVDPTRLVDHDVRLRLKPWSSD